MHNIVLLVLLGGLIGLAVDLARTGLEREEQVLLERERLHERERIARVVHDGVLQSLAYIHRRGRRDRRRGGRAVGHRRRAGALPAPLRLRHRCARGRPVGRPARRRGRRGRPAGAAHRARAPRRRSSRCLPTRSSSTGSSRCEVDAAVAAALDNVDAARRRRRPRLAAARGRLARHRADHPRRRRRRRPRRPARGRRARPDGRQRLHPRPGRGPRRHRHLDHPPRRRLRRADDGAARPPRPTATRPDRRPATPATPAQPTQEPR